MPCQRVSKCDAMGRHNNHIHCLRVGCAVLNILNNRSKVSIKKVQRSENMTQIGIISRHNMNSEALKNMNICQCTNNFEQCNNYS